MRLMHLFYYKCGRHVYVLITTDVSKRLDLFDPPSDSQLFRQMTFQRQECTKFKMYQQQCAFTKAQYPGSACNDRELPGLGPLEA